MQKLKNISVSLGVVVSLAAFAGINYAQAENIKLPLPANDPDIQAVVDGVKRDMGANGDVVKEIMRQTRDRIKEEQSKRLPLIRHIGDAVSQSVSTRVREQVRTETRKSQMAAMTTIGPQGIPDIIAPTFD